MTHPLEDVDINRIPDYETRSHARARAATVGTDLEVPTRTIDHKPDLPGCLRIRHHHASHGNYFERHRSYDQDDSQALHSKLSRPYDPGHVAMDLSPQDYARRKIAEFELCRELLMQKCTELIDALEKLEREARDCSFNYPGIMNAPLVVPQRKPIWCDLQEYHGEEYQAIRRVVSLLQAQISYLEDLLVERRYEAMENFTVDEFTNSVVEVEDSTRDLRNSFQRFEKELRR